MQIYTMRSVKHVVAMKTKSKGSDSTNAIFVLMISCTYYRETSYWINFTDEYQSSIKNVSYNSWEKTPCSIIIGPSSGRDMWPVVQMTFYYKKHRVLSNIWVNVTGSAELHQMHSICCWAWNWYCIPKFEVYNRLQLFYSGTETWPV